MASDVRAAVLVGPDGRPAGDGEHAADLAALAGELFAAVDDAVRHGHPSPPPEHVEAHTDRGSVFVVRRDGWTLVLASLPTSAGRDAAVAKAKQALAAGLSQVGVIDSSRYASLHPGYFVVFSGIYASLSSAQDAASRAASAGYGNAYARRLTT